MNTDDFFRADPSTALSALIVDPTPASLRHVVSVLSKAGFQAIAAESFARAKALLAGQRPDILVTAIRLGEYNGLHLALRGKANRTDLAALVTSPVSDPVLMADAESMNATFIVTPVSDEELVAAVWRTLFRSSGSSEQIRPPFERRRQERRAIASVEFAGPDRRERAERRRMGAPHPVQLFG
jgi:DNA-binding response OmpR family regulator